MFCIKHFYVKLQEFVKLFSFKINAGLYKDFFKYSTKRRHYFSKWQLIKWQRQF